MEKEIALYKQCVKQLLSKYEALTTNETKVELVFDEKHLRYMAVRLGWSKQRRIHLCLVHIDISNDQVIIQANNTEDMVATELVLLGIPKEKIQLGFLPPGLQAFSALPVSNEQLEPM